MSNSSSNRAARDQIVTTGLSTLSESWRFVYSLFDVVFKSIILDTGWSYLHDVHTELCGLVLDRFQLQHLVQRQWGYQEKILLLFHFKSEVVIFWWLFFNCYMLCTFLNVYEVKSPRIVWTFFFNAMNNQMLAVLLKDTILIMIGKVDHLNLHYCAKYSNLK